VGILLSRFVPFGSGELAAGAAALLALGAVCLRRGARLRAGCCCLLGLVLAGALCDVARRPGPAPELDAEGEVVISGCVVEPPALADGRERFVLDLERDARAQVTVYLREGERPPHLAYGQLVEVDARVRRPQNYRNPGAFDYARYLARQDVYWTASASGAAAVRRLSGECGSRFGRAVTAMRVSALERIERLYRGRPYEAGMMQAILIGQTFQLEKIWTEQFRRTGTIHALVISGTHVAVLAAFFLFLMRLCLVPRGIAAVVTAGGAWVYALVTGWQAPCVRAAAGFTLFMIGRHFFRERRLVNLLAAVAIAFLVFDPEQMFEASFQLSFLAVAFLALFAVPLLEGTVAPLARGLAGLRDTGRDPHLPPRVAAFRVEMRLLAETLELTLRAPAWAAAFAVAAVARVFFYAVELFTISAVVQAGLALPMVIYFHRVGLSGLTANLLVIPLMGAVVPAGFVAMLTGWSWAAEMAGVALAATRAVVEWHAVREPHWRVPDPPWWLAVALCAALIAAAMAVRLRPRWRALPLAAALVLLGLVLAHPFAPDVRRGQLEVTSIDVGQGDAFFVAFPEGKLITVDAGGFPRFGERRTPARDTGEDVVSPYLWRRSVRRLDAVAVSHAHADHNGGVPALIENFRPRELWTGPAPDCAESRTVRERAARFGVTIRELRAGDAFDYGGASIGVLAPTADYRPGAEPVNADSLVLRVAYGRHAFLLTGDLERATEADLVAAGVPLRATVLKLGHHGSRTSSTAAFLDAVHPAFAIVTAGEGNMYRYPHAEVIQRLEERRIQPLRTDRHGCISFRTDGRYLEIETAAWKR
jgi:competence protein ComEC